MQHWLILRDVDAGRVTNASGSYQVPGLWLLLKVSQTPDGNPWRERETSSSFNGESSLIATQRSSKPHLPILCWIGPSSATPSFFLSSERPLRGDACPDHGSDGLFSV